MKAPIDLSSTFVYDYKMSTGSSSAKCNNQENYTELLKEGVTTIFRVVYLYTDSIFCDTVILHCHIILFTGMNIIVVRSP